MSTSDNGTGECPTEGSVAPHAAAATRVVRTTNIGLQAQLDSWANDCIAICSLPSGSGERLDAVLAFSRTFVPGDTSEDDMAYFSSNLAEDEEYFLSVKRDIEQCASGRGVESIKGNQRKKATFTLLPLEGTLAAGSELDIVKELCFIYNSAFGWRAELMFSDGLGYLYVISGMNARLDPSSKCLLGVSICLCCLSLGTMS